MAFKIKQIFLLGFIAGLLFAPSIWGQENPLRIAEAADSTLTLQAARELDRVVSTATYILPQDDETNSVLTVEDVPAKPVPDDSVPTLPGSTLEGEIISGDYLGNLCASRLGICADGCLIPCPRFVWERYTFFSGINAFTGPLNRGGPASFGFSEGFNYGRSLDCIGRGELTAQLGLRGTQTNLSGNDVTTSDRKQLFMTLGVFHRADWGLQGGAVVDYMHEDWNYDLDLMQVRTELSWKYPDCYEIGFAVNFDADHGVSHATVGKTNPSVVDESWTSLDVYRFFIRKTNPDNGVISRLVGGFTGNKDGILGADIRAPINEKWALDASFSYLIPEEGSATTGFREECWNVGINMVYFPGCKTPYDLDYNTPLFDVGSNGNFFVDQQ